MLTRSARSDLVSEDPAPYGKRPERLRMSVEEFDAWYPKQGKLRAEWSNGNVEIPMPVGRTHDLIFMFLVELLNSFLRRKKSGEMYGDRFQIRIGVRREPDISFLLNEHLHRAHETYIEGPPDFVIEVLSPDSVKRDNEDKFKEYESGKIPEYWKIDPEHKALVLYRLNPAGKYKAVAPKNGKFESSVLSGFYLRADWLWNTKNVDPNELLKEMGL